MTTAFRGRLVERAEAGTHGYVLVFDATRVWKGSVKRRQVIYQMKSIDMSSVNVGLEYVVFANSMTTDEAARLGAIRRRSSLVALDCNGAQRYAPDDAGLRRLGEGHVIR